MVTPIRVEDGIRCTFQHTAARRAPRRRSHNFAADWRALSLSLRALPERRPPVVCTSYMYSSPRQCSYTMPCGSIQQQRSRPLSVCVIFATRSLCVLVQENVLVLLILSADCGKCRKDSAKKYDVRGLGLIFLPTLTSTALYLAPDRLVCALRAQSLLSYCTVHLFLSLMVLYYSVSFCRTNQCARCIVVQ